jgi:hypothetical protein
MRGQATTAPGGGDKKGLTKDEVFVKAEEGLHMITKNPFSGGSTQTGRPYHCDGCSSMGPLLKGG